MAKGKKKVAGNLQSVEETESITPVSDGLKAMSDDDVAKYLKALATGKVTVEGLELTISDQLKKVAKRRMEIEQRIARLRQELDRLANEAAKGQGEMDGHTRLLVIAEDTRRAKGGK